MTVGLAQACDNSSHAGHTNQQGAKGHAAGSRTKGADTLRAKFLILVGQIDFFQEYTSLRRKAVG